MPSRKSHAQLLRKTGGVGLSFLGVFSLADGEKFSLRATLHRFFHYFPFLFLTLFLAAASARNDPNRGAHFLYIFAAFPFFFTPLTPPLWLWVGIWKMRNLPPPFGGLPFRENLDQSRGGESQLPAERGNVTCSHSLLLAYFCVCECGKARIFLRSTVFRLYLSIYMLIA